MTSKSELRKIFKQKRDSLDADEVLTRSRRINENFLQNLFPKIYQQNPEGIFSLYLASGKEVSSYFIADFFEKNRIKFCYPQIIKKDRHLDFALHDEKTNLITSKFYPQILEPAAGKKIFPDFLIIPLLAFDSDLSRLGMGGGFFDRTIDFLKKKKSHIVTIGLAFDLQQSRASLPLDHTDCRLDFIVTEKNIFSSSHS